MSIACVEHNLLVMVEYSPVGGMRHSLCICEIIVLHCFHDFFFDGFEGCELQIESVSVHICIVRPSFKFAHCLLTECFVRTHMNLGDVMPTLPQILMQSSAKDDDTYEMREEYAWLAINSGSMSTALWRVMGHPHRGMNDNWFVFEGFCTVTHSYCLLETI